MRRGRSRPRGVSVAAAATSALLSWPGLRRRTAMAQDEFDDFEQLARQYWNAWGDMRCVTSAARQRQPGRCRAGTTPWTGGRSSPRAQRHPASGATTRSTASTRRRSAGSGRCSSWPRSSPDARPSAADIAAAWKQALGARWRQPVRRHVQGTMPARASTASTQWIEQMRAVAAMRGSARAASWLGLPAFGFAREHQERWQHARAGAGRLPGAEPAPTTR